MSASTWLIVLLSLTSGLGAAEAPFGARVVAVHDGDTITATTASGPAVRIRLEGIDCPELGQPFSKRARERTRELVLFQDVRIVPRSVDVHGRLIARVHVRDIDLSEVLVREGLAWHYRQYSSDPILAAAEASAHALNKGLWRDPEPVPPWKWRRPAEGPTTRRRTDPDRHADGSAAGPVHGNRRSHVYHLPGCANYNCRNCTAVFADAATAKTNGYRPAGCCRN